MFEMLDSVKCIKYRHLEYVVSFNFLLLFVYFFIIIIIFYCSCICSSTVKISEKHISTQMY